MKKLLLLSALLIAGIFSASAQYQRRVLVEEFTNASCGPCASQNPGFNAVLLANTTKITPIKYQTVWPGVDPMNAQNQSDVATRVTYYGVDGVPNAFMDGPGVVNDCNAYDNAPACLTGAEIDANYAVTSPVNVVVTHSLSPDFLTININVAVTSDIALTGALRLHVAVVEDEIIFDAAPGTNGEKEFFQVMRKMLPNANGTTTGDFAAGETKTYTFSWPIGYAYNLNQLGASAWLQENSTKAVFNSARSLPIGGIPAIGASVSGTSGFACVAGVSPSFTLSNEAAANLTSSLIQYKVGNGAWVDYPWTGNLAPGASEVITLTDVVISAPGTTNVSVRVLTSNLGIQTNLVGVLSMSIKALLDPPVALPFANPFQSAAFPPAGWNVTNTATTPVHGWKLATNAGAGSTRSAKNDMFDYPNADTELITPKVDLSTASGTTTLTFDHAYTWYDAFNFDSLRIDVSANCGATWTTIFHDGYEGLATAPALLTAFTPTANQWVANTLDISNYNGATELFVRFTAESGFGNNLYLDNVNINTSTGVKNLDLSDFTLMPNPTSNLTSVRFGLPAAQNIQLMVFNNLGSLVQTRDLGELTSGEHTVSLDAMNLNSGSYRVVLQGKDGIAQTQWIVLK